MNLFNSMKATSILIATIGLTVGQPAQANTNAPPASVDALVARALNGNPEIELYLSQIELARAGVQSAGHRTNPELSLSLGHKRAYNGAAYDNGHAFGAALAQRIDFPQRIRLRKAIANGDVRLAELGLEKFRVTIANRIRSAAFGWQAARERAEVARGVAERAGQLLDALTQRDPAGVAPLLQRRVIEAHIVQLRRQMREYESESRRHAQELNYLIGAPLDAPVQLADLRPVLPSPWPDGELLARAETNSFDLLFHAEEIRQQGYRVKLARHERWPEVTLEPFFARESGAGPQNIIGLGVSLPLPIWNRNEGAIAAATAREKQLSAAFSVTLRQLHRDVIFESHAYRAAWNQLQEWSPEAVTEFKKAAELGDRHFRLGAINVSTYLELQTQYLDAIDALLRQKEEAYNHLLQLELLTGTELNAKDPS